MQYSPELWTTGALLAMRTGGLLLIAPVFSARSVPAHLKAALIVLLTLVLLPGALRQGVTPQLTIATALSETLIGFALGFGAAVLIGAVEVAGDALAVQTGLSSASTLDPFTQFGTPSLAQFLSLFAVTLLLVTGGHLAMMRAVGTSVELLPVGSAIDWEAGITSLISTGSLLFSLGLRFAAPVLAAALISNITLGVLARAAPQMNMLAVAFPLQIGVGLIVVGASLPFLATYFASFNDHYGSIVGSVLRSFGAGS